MTKLVMQKDISKVAVKVINLLTKDLKVFSTVNIIMACMRNIIKGSHPVFDPKARPAKSPDINRCLQDLVTKYNTMKTKEIVVN